MSDKIVLKFAENQLAKGRVVWYNEKGKYIEFEAIGLGEGWFTNEELEKLEIKEQSKNESNT